MNFLANIFRFFFNLFQKLTPKSYQIDPIPPINPPFATPPANAPTPPKYLWDTYEHSVHSVRVLCDEQGLSLSQKNLICAVIQGESQFNNKATNQNKNSKGQVTSTDWGICQINDRYHIGLGKDFPTVQYVLDNPDKSVSFMIDMFKAGKINLWCAYSNGSYHKWLLLFD